MSQGAYNYVVIPSVYSSSQFIPCHLLRFIFSFIWTAVSIRSHYTEMLLLGPSEPDKFIEDLSPRSHLSTVENVQGHRADCHTAALKTC